MVSFGLASRLAASCGDEGLVVALRGFVGELGDGAAHALDALLAADAPAVEQHFVEPLEAEKLAILVSIVRRGGLGDAVGV